MLWEHTDKVYYTFINNDLLLEFGWSILFSNMKWYSWDIYDIWAHWATDKNLLKQWKYYYRMGIVVGFCGKTAVFKTNYILMCKSLFYCTISKVMILLWE